MNAVDWVIVAIVVLFAAGGYGRGFVVGALSLGGFVVGALLGARIGPLVLDQGSRSPYAPLFALGGALLIGGLIGAGFERLGRHARRLLWVPGLRQLDGLLGAVLTACIALGVVWIAGAALVQNLSAGRLRTDLASSRILRDLNRALPPSGPVLGALARVDPLPSVNGPSANVAAPNLGITGAAGVRAAGSSVVRVIGTACGLGVEGSGWAAGDGLVVTNAHVVAGETDTQVQLGGVGRPLGAEVVVFDAHNDIAVLRVPGLGAPALRLDGDANVATGTSGSILGYPEDGPFDRQAARLGRTELTATQNAYGDGPVLREIAALRGLVRPGNSGGPIVDASGEVIATVFAAVTNSAPGDPGGFAVPNSVVATELAKALRARAPASTAGCAD